MKKTNEQNILEAVSLIAPEYVEAAVYPAAGAKKTLTARKNWWKPVMTAAAAVVIGVTCVGFAPRALAFAEQLFSGRVVFEGDGQSMEGAMEKVHIKDDVVFQKEDELLTFRSLGQTEDFLGITLLHSDLAIQKSAPTVTLFAVHQGKLIEIADDYYYLYGETMDSDGNVKKQREDAYHIRYNAVFLSNRDDSAGLESEYSGAKLVEHYVTANGLEAGIFDHSDKYHAVIYRDNIQYDFTFDCWNDEPGDLNPFKAFLDTLK